VPSLLAKLGVEAPAAGRFVEGRIGETDVVLAGWGDSGERAAQLFVAPERAAAVGEAVLAAGGDALVQGDPGSLEVLRIEAGTPRMGVELDEEVLPAEAGLVERAVSFTKGCFTGQEIVARLQSRGQVSHRLVGLAFEGAQPPEPGQALALPDGKVVGEVTSSCHSSLGAIGLGYVRRPHDEPDTRLAAGSDPACVRALPFVRPAA
jgi:folate-binding protein YgfZ